MRMAETVPPAQLSDGQACLYVFDKMRPRRSPGAVMPNHHHVDRPQTCCHNGLLLCHTRITQKQRAVSGTLNFQHAANGVFIFLATIDGLEAGLICGRPPEPETYTVYLPVHILLAA